MFVRRSLLALTLLWSVPAAAVEVHRAEPLALPESLADTAASRPPLRLAESLGVDPIAALRRAEEGAGDRLDALRAHNAAGRLPVQIGFSRPLPEALAMRFDAAPLPAFQRHGGGYAGESLAGRRVWGTHVRVAGAWRLRLRLERVELPAGTRLWVWGLGEEPRELGLDLLGPDGFLWTPSVSGEDAFLEVELPDGRSAGRLEVREIAQAFRLEAGGAPALAPETAGPVTGALGECLQDATCHGSGSFEAIDQARKAIAHLEFLVDGDLFVCSGGLLNDTVPSSAIPYFLTANHCLATQAEVSTLEAFWDYRTSSCNGSVPDPGALPRSNGGTLLATSENSDFTLMRLNTIPGGRILLGWTTQALAHGTVLHRVSHPAPDGFPLPQMYSRTTVHTTTAICSGAPRPRYVYAMPQLGGTFGGSSGSPVMTGGGHVVGQLLGGCGATADDGCDPDNSELDGAFSATYPGIAGYLNPAPSGGPCTPSGSTLCIDDKPGDRRFRIQVSYQSAQQSGAGTAVPLSSLGVNSGGLFWFFGATNPEMLIKVLNGCGLNNKYWVFWAAGTNVGLTVTVEDTVSGAKVAYTNPNGKAAVPVQDTSALPCS